MSEDPKSAIASASSLSAAPNKTRQEQIKSFIQSCYDTAKNHDISYMFNTSLSELLDRAVHLRPGTPFTAPSCLQGTLFSQGLFADRDSRNTKDALWDKCRQEVDEKWKQSIQEIQSQYSQPYKERMASHLQKAQEHAVTLGITDTIDAKVASGIWLAFSKRSELSGLSFQRVQFRTTTLIFDCLLSENLSALALEAIEISQEQSWDVDCSENQH